MSDLSIDEKRERSLASKELVKFHAWKWIEEELKRLIDKNKSIMFISEDNVEKDFWKQKIKVNVYQYILNLPHKWIKEERKWQKKEK